MNDDVTNLAGLATLPLREVKLIEENAIALDRVMSQSLAPDKKREALEEVAINWLRVANGALEYFWGVLELIGEEGLWRTARKENGEPYKQRVEYEVDFYQRNVGLISKASVYAMRGRIAGLKEMGIDPATALKMAVRLPMLAETVASLGERAADGSFIELTKDERAKIDEELGVGEDEELTDAQRLNEYAEHLVGVEDRKEARASVEQVAGIFKKQIRYLPAEHAILFRVIQGGKKYELKARFSKDAPVPRAIRAWLESMSA